MAPHPKVRKTLFIDFYEKKKFVISISNLDSTSSLDLSVSAKFWEIFLSFPTHDISPVEHFDLIIPLHPSIFTCVLSTWRFHSGEIRDFDLCGHDILP